MKLSKRSKWAVGLLTVSALGVAACKGTMGLECSAVVMGQQGSIKLAYDGRDVKAEQLPDNNRVDILFFDADGNAVPNSGATGVAQGDKVPVPAGANYCEISGVSAATSCAGCAPPSGGAPPGGGGGMFESIESVNALALGPQVGLQQKGGANQLRAATSIGSKWVYVYTLDADIDGSSAWANVSGSFVILGTPSASDMHAKIAGILSTGHGAPVPADVTVDTFVRIVPEMLGGRVFIADKTSAFTQFTMDWNTAPYAQLGSANTSISAAPNGWQVIEVFIPMADFNITAQGGSSNRADIMWKTSEDSTTNEMHQGMTYN